MLNICKVSKAYGGLPVVEDLSLRVDRGEIAALVGPSGCGKTTLLNMVSGLVQPDFGSIEKGDVRLSYMFQKARLLPWRTVYQNIALVREDVKRNEIEDLIQAVGLGGFEEYYPSQLSGGMAKRCALARAFHYQGDIVLMDEPFQGLDYGMRMEMLSMLISIWKQKKQGILFVTHEIDEALTAATKIVVLRARPTAVQEEIYLPGQVGRDAAAPELAQIRRHIIHRMMPGA